MSQPPVLTIDEEGFVFSGDKKIQDIRQGSQVLESLFYRDNGSFGARIQDQEYLVEPFDEPLVIYDLELHGEKLSLFGRYDTEFVITPDKLTCDEWDRFHGYNKAGIPFVLTDVAQEKLFELADDFDDDNITLDDVEYPTLPHFAPQPEVNDEKFWSKIYKEENFRWDLKQPAPALLEHFPPMKLAKSKILVLGCGFGHDAGYFAQQGHIVTAVDISPLALKKAKELYPQPNIRWVEQDLFKFAEEMDRANERFDLIFEHTCYCAIDPSMREKLTSWWSRLLARNGFLVAILFAMERKNGPPFGGTEWEYRKRLSKKFRFLLWGRYRHSIDRREGKELFILAQKKEGV